MVQPLSDPGQRAPIPDSWRLLALSHGRKQLAPRSLPAAAGPSCLVHRCWGCRVLILHKAWQLAGGAAGISRLGACLVLSTYLTSAYVPFLLGASDGTQGQAGCLLTKF